MKNAMLVVTIVAAAGCAPRTFDCRVDVAPLRQKLAAAGEDASHILRPQRAADLDALVAGKKYRYVVDAHGALAVAPLPNDAQGNEYVHPILGGGAPVRTAGMLWRQGARVTVNQDSKSYCPTKASLKEAVRALHAIGVADVAVEDAPPACVAAHDPVLDVAPAR